MQQCETFGSVGWRRFDCELCLIARRYNLRNEMWVVHMRFNLRCGYLRLPRWLDG